MSCLSIGIDWTRPRDILASHFHALLPINKRQSISWDEIPAVSHSAVSFLISVQRLSSKLGLMIHSINDTNEQWTPPSQLDKFLL